MNRKTFILSAMGIATASAVTALKSLSEKLPEQDIKMPFLFVGHGSPMNAIEDNEFSQRWKQMGQEIPRPKAVICVSAHWLTNGLFITAMNQPKTIHDFGGFPKELFNTQYPAPGNPQLAGETKQLLQPFQAELDHDWGLDHGTWSVVKNMYPDADIPVLQLSINYSKPASYHYEIGKYLGSLRKKGVLIIGSGNMVHNLGMIGAPPGQSFSFDHINQEFGYDWALEINGLFKKFIQERNHQALINYNSIHKSIAYAIPSPDHYFPLLYALGMQEQNDDAFIFNDKAIAGSLTMTSVKFG
ncbi:MAG TPA: 4,5-DOPA dioxygenase extradiol [Chitinophagaceae bacterium]|nr:4,5-DOPA dioxygenase extradiol [Chitinophagaceae bacterium]